MTTRVCGQPHPEDPTYTCVLPAGHEGNHTPTDETADEWVSELERILSEGELSGESAERTLSRIAALVADEREQTCAHADCGYGECSWLQPGPVPGMCNTHGNGEGRCQRDARVNEDGIKRWFRVGERVALAPHLDLWMAGCRYGTVVTRTVEAPGLVPETFYHVDLDTGRRVTLRHSELSPVVNENRP